MTKYDVAGFSASLKNKGDIHGLPTMLFSFRYYHLKPHEKLIDTRAINEN